MAYSLPTQFMDGEYSLATATLADIMPELQEKIQVPPNQRCGSGSGYRSDSESGYRVLITKKIFITKLQFSDP
jgi:hypothetical protein